MDTLLTGLSRLEYRGYDSAGIACDGDKEGEVRCDFRILFAMSLSSVPTVILTTLSPSTLDFYF